tara:strand:+ start:141 stop:923 length:783 start_codon:yes stop_codon:yes gene_type:complete
MDNNELTKILATGSQDVVQAMMICKSLHQNLGEIMQKMSDDFVGEGIDVSSILPSMDQAIYFKNFYIQVLKIYGWDPECNDESELLPAVAEREKYYDTYFNEGLNLVEEIKNLKEDNEELKERQLPFGWTIDSIKNLQEERDELKAENTEQSCEIINLQGENEELKKYGKGYLLAEVKKLKEENKNLKEGNEALNSLVKMYKAQIPKKPRKCFSQNDKARLRRVREILGSFASDDKASDDPCNDDWYDDETLKLLDRLLK